jgi:hypothetical protein
MAFEPSIAARLEIASSCVGFSVFGNPEHAPAEIAGRSWRGSAALWRSSSSSKENP